MRNNKGFLLLEVILTIVIIATGLIFVTRVYSAAGQIIHRSMVLFRSGLLMEDRMFEFEEKGRIKKDFTDHGDFPTKNGDTPLRRTLSPFLGKGYSWEIKSESAADEESFSSEESVVNLVALDVIFGASKQTLVTFLRNKR